MIFTLFISKFKTPYQLVHNSLLQNFIQLIKNNILQTSTSYFFFAESSSKMFLLFWCFFLFSFASDDKLIKLIHIVKPSFLLKLYHSNFIQYTPVCDLLERRHMLHRHDEPVWRSNTSIQTCQESYSAMSDVHHPLQLCDRTEC